MNCFDNIKCEVHYSLLIRCSISPPALHFANNRLIAIDFPLIVGTLKIVHAQHWIRLNEDHSENHKIKLTVADAQSPVSEKITGLQPTHGDKSAIFGHREHTGKILDL